MSETLGPGTSIGRFEVVRLLGRGGFGAVYEARDTDLGRHVALKIVRADRPDRAELLEMFGAEAKAAARLNHPNVVTIHDHGVHDGEPYLVLELLAGETLARRLARGPLPPADAVAILAQVCRGLVHAHAAGVIHRDLKPSNLFVRDDGQVKILDFGLARVGQALTRPGGTPAYMAPEQWRGGAQDERADVFACGAILFEMLSGALPYAVSSGGRDDLDASIGTLGPRLAGVSPRIVAVCERALARDPRDRTPSAQALLDGLLAIERDGVPATTAQPYRFLDPFGEVDAGWFFGRDAEILRLEQLLAARPLVAIVGHAGAGKSSLVHGGLLPRLRRAGGWTIVSMRPGAEPLERLHERLVEICGEARVAVSLAGPEALVETPGRAGLLLRRHAAAEHGKILLVVDQLEELVTHGASPRVRRAFAQALLSIADDPQGPLRIVTALRDDFLVRLSKIAELREALPPGMLLLGPPTVEGLADALRAPAARLGYGYEPGLVERIVAEVGDEAAPLPLLQLAASRLWERRDPATSLLTRAELDAAGGVAGILAAHAGEVLEALPDALLPRRMLCELVTEEGTRRRVRRQELCARFADPRAAGQTLEGLVSGRLVSAYRSERDEWVELAHESLIAGWDQLRDWLAEDRADRQFRERLRAAATLWAERGRPPELLWSGETLDETLRRRRRFTGTLGEVEQAFLGRAEAGLRRTRRVRRGVFLAAAACAVVGTVTSAIAVRAYRAAAREARLREIARRAAAADDPLLGALILAELAAEPEPPGGLAAAVQVATRAIPRAEYRGHRGAEVSRCEWSPDDVHIASSAESKGQIHVWRADGTGVPVALPIGSGGFQFSPDGDRLFVARADSILVTRVDGTGAPMVLPAPVPSAHPHLSADGRKLLAVHPLGWSATLFSTEGRGEPLVFPLAPLRIGGKVQTLQVGDADLSPDGTRVIVAGEGLGLWRADGVPLAFRPGEQWSGAVFSPDGSRILAWHPNNELWVMGADLGRPRRIPGAIMPFALSADGRRIVFKHERGAIRVMAADGTGPALELEPRRSAWRSSTYHPPSLSPDGARVLVPGTDRAEIFWADGLGQSTTLAHRGDAWFSHDGTRIAGCDVFSDTVRVWPAGDPPGTRSFHGHQAAVVSAVASPDGRTLLTSSLDGTVRLWPIAGGAPTILGEPGGPSAGPAIFSPDGRRVAAAGRDGRIRVWPAAGGAPRTLEVPWPARGLAFSPDGALLAAGGGEGGVLVLRPEAAAPVARLKMLAAPESLAFSPDGARLVGAGSMGPALVWRADDWASDPLALGAAERAVFDPRGERVLGGTLDEPVRLWARDGREIAAPRMPGGRAVAFSPDGARIAVGLSDGTARVGRLDGRGDPIVIRGHPGAVQTVSFTPDGRWLATTAEGDPIAHLWLVDWAELGAALRAATTACLTPEQRTSHLFESPATARAAWERCERRNGRTP